MATALTIYNGALAHLGEQALTTTSDAVDRRRKLDAVYDKAKAWCLESGFWNFAIRSVESTPDAPTPEFYYAYQYTKPSDWVRTAAISASESYDPPLNDFMDITGTWLSNVNPMYVQYVSNHATAGGGLLSAWPASYEEFVSGYLAQLACMSITQDKGLYDRLKMTIVPDLRKSALSRDAMNGPSKRFPVGTWVRARGNDIGRRYDRG